MKRGLLAAVVAFAAVVASNTETEAIPKIPTVWDELADVRAELSELKNMNIGLTLALEKAQRTPQEVADAQPPFQTTSLAVAGKGAGACVGHPADGKAKGPVRAAGRKVGRVVSAPYRFLFRR